MIRSKPSLFVYFFTLLLSGFVVLGFTFLLHPQWQFKNKFGGTGSAVVPGIILVVAMGAILCFILLRVVFLRIDNDMLYLTSLRKRRLLARGDIQTIDLWGRKRFNGAPGDVINIAMKDGVKYTYEDWYCGNLAKLKRTLQAEYTEFLVAPPENHVRPGVSVEPVVFSGRVLTSTNGILFYGSALGFLGFDMYHHLNPFVQPFLWLALPIEAMLPVIMGIQLFYFRLTADSLEIRNHILPFYRKRYLLTEIAGIFLETRTNWSHALRVRTYDYRSNKFYAGTLRDRDWLALGKALKKRGIQVKSELPGVKIYA